MERGRPPRGGRRGRPSKSRGNRGSTLPRLHNPVLPNNDLNMGPVDNAGGSTVNPVQDSIGTPDTISPVVSHTANTSYHSPEELRKENEELTLQLNEFKKRLKESDHTIAEQESSMKALRKSIVRTELENTDLQAEITALKRTNQDILTRTIDAEAKKGGRLLEKLTLSIPKKMLGIALKIESDIGKWASRETCELVFNSPFHLRNWNGRSEPTSHLGINTQQGSIVYPYNPVDVAARGGYYIPSCKNAVESLRETTLNELENSEWSCVFPDEESKTETLNVLVSNNTLLMKMKQSLSDACSTRKRQARDHLFIVLKYNRLVSRFQISDSSEIAAKILEIETAKGKLRKKVPGTESYDFGWWRTATRMELERLHENPSTTNNANDDQQEKDQLLLFRDQDILKTYHLFLGYVPNSCGSIVETSIVSLARLDAWINCVVELLIPHEKRGGHRQRLYGDAFFSMLRLSLMQLLGTFYAYVRKWNDWELESPVVGEDTETRKKNFLEMNREATLIVKCPKSQRYFLTIQDEWFLKYISKDLGHVHDCYIAKVSEDFSEITCTGNICPTLTSSMFDNVGTPSSFLEPEDEDVFSHT